jgi:hypothetical protein
MRGECDGKKDFKNENISVFVRGDKTQGTFARLLDLNARCGDSLACYPVTDSSPIHRGRLWNHAYRQARRG